MTNNHLLITHLQTIIRDYLDTHKRISLNGLSKRCSVSEPTLRRIMNGQVKTAPTLTTVIDILSTIGKESRVSKLVEMYPGPIGEALKEGFSVTEDQGLDYEYSQELNKELSDTQAYLVFKLAANTSGTTRDNIQNLFGLLGIEKLEMLLEKELLIESEGIVKTKVENFRLAHDLFVKHFKACADFINTSQQNGRKTNLYYNFSESLNEQGRREILHIQRQALRKIAKIMNEPKFKGSLPVFTLVAVDVLDKDQPPKILQ